jgi:phosphoribosylanthranilate isomerase
MKRILVKVCGLTRSEDVAVAVAAGVDALGFVFTASPRRVSAQKACELGRIIPSGVLRIGLFLNQDRDEVARVVDTVELDMLQFHGNETEEQCNGFGLPYIKAVSMQDSHSAEQAEREYPGASGLLLDSHLAGKPGGSGKIFDWSLTKPGSKPVWLAGGLNAENVGQAIERVRPYAVDVSSGVESSPGIKDAAKIDAFVRAVRCKEQELMSDDES